ncbi:hypothetical protein [Sorangium sp. So ce1151]|uniref:hypothetical protein n=1 Tax=Sorangium sp. So ce1151 TaxID=3133332 RepID=UPI003F6203D0
MVVEIRQMNAICVLGWVDRLHIAVWRGSGVDESHMFYREMKAGIARFGSGVGHLAVIEPGTPLPPPEARKVIARVFNEHPGAVSAVSVASEGQGFFASAVRSVATGLMMLTRTPVPFRLSGSVVDSAAFLSKHIVSPDGAPHDGRLYVHAVLEMRRKLHQQVPRSA